MKRQRLWFENIMVLHDNILGSFLSVILKLVCVVGETSISTVKSQLNTLWKICVRACMCIGSYSYPK